MVVRDDGIQTRGTFFKRLEQILVCAHYVDIIGKTWNDVKSS
jgi:hypothetical protein